jgi:serine/threonine protein kinase
MTLPLPPHCLPQSALLYFPPHLKGTPFASFVAGAMARDPRRRPSAAQLLRHEWLAQHAHPAGELHRASTLPAPAKPAAADSPSPPAFNIQVVAGGARSDDLNGAAAASEGPAPRAAGLKHSHSESSAALLAAAQKAASLEREQSQAAEGSSLGHAAPQHGGAYSMRRRADSAPAHGAAAALLAQHQRRARRLPLQPASSSSGGDSPREQPTPNSVLHRLNTAASVSMDWLLQAQRAGRPRKPSRLSRSSSSTAAEAPGGGAPGQERGREGEEDDTEDSAGGGSLGSTQGQLGRIKSYLAGQRGHWSRKFSVGRAASSSVLSSASAEGA